MPDEQLRAIVQRMIDAGESEANIATVIQGYKPVATPVVNSTSADAPGINGGTMAANTAAGMLPLVRPTAELAGQVFASPATATALKVGGRLAGGAAGMALSPGGLGKFTGAALGGGIGGKIGSSIAAPLQRGGQILADAAGDGFLAPVRGALGRFGANPAKVLRGGFDALDNGAGGGILPKVGAGLSGIGYLLAARDVYNKYAPGIQHPKQPGEERDFYDPGLGVVTVQDQRNDRTNREVEDRLNRQQHGQSIGQDINLPNESGESAIDLNNLSPQQRDMLLQLLQQR